MRALSAYLVEWSSPLKRSRDSDQLTFETMLAYVSVNWKSRRTHGSVQKTLST